MLFDTEKIKELLREFPGLTGKQIAKKLGYADKSALNSFLYSHSQGLKRVEWKWYVEEEYVLVLNADTWIDENVFEANLSSGGCLLSGIASRCRISFPENCKILLAAGARVIALANQAAFSGKAVELDFSKCPSTKNFLDRLGFFDHLHTDVKVKPERPTESRATRYRGNSDNLVEIASINIEDFDNSIPVKLTKKFALHAGQEYYMAVFTIFSELIGNVRDHSETPIPGFAALQLYKGKRRHIQTVISDSGLGIATTLKRNLETFYPEVFKALKSSTEDTDVFLVTQALKKGGLSQFGSAPDKAARGLGLKRSQEWAAKYDAIVLVRQPNFELKILYENGELIEITMKKGLALIKGTQVCFDFFLGYD
ncbi:hypothetical protein [Enterobacter hormaechei]|uniref:hypothetical protein n=1 Tax=Enterobacter hormaechei TaxID=158836 RepID=UPI0028655E4D|nr:hypothetical protein [Enterobacter hormaechei]EKW6205507.1 hypothetical protein [Enterobacter hormaechei]ELC7297226.1 hypothetical protein [Enterobacter hormaechei]MDV5636121.1 hypothetical protein [Enterobacter hormaechei]